MGILRYFYLKLYYFIYRFLFIYLLQFLNYSPKKFFFWKKIFFLLKIIFVEFFNDYHLLRINISKYIYFFKKLKFIWKLLLLFLFLQGWISILLKIYIYFFLMKYIFKYLFLILDFSFFYDQSKYIYYYYFRNFIINFFNIIPLWLLKIYKFLIKFFFTLYFWRNLSLSIRTMKKKIFYFIINKIDDFIEVSGPIMLDYLSNYNNKAFIQFMIYYYKIKKFIFRTIPWRIKRFIYYKIYIKLYNIFVIDFYINYIKKFYIYPILLIYYRIKRFCLKSSINIHNLHNYLFLKYKHVQYYSIYLYKVFIPSYACYVAIEDFITLNFRNGRAYFYFFFYYSYWIIHYYILLKIYELKIYFLKKYYFKDINNLSYFIHCLRIFKFKRKPYRYKISNLKLYFYISFVYNLLNLLILTLLKINSLFIDIEGDIYFYTCSFKKLIWFNFVLDDIILRKLILRMRWPLNNYYYYSSRETFYILLYHLHFFWTLELNDYEAFLTILRILKMKKKV